MTEEIDEGMDILKCPYCGMELHEDDSITWYYNWITCFNCGKNFEVRAKVKTTYYVKNR